MPPIRHKPLPRGRLGRALRLGKLATGVAGGVVGAGAGQWLRGKRVGAVDLLLNPANATRISAQLAEMRGAAMKVGQLLSLEAGDWLPDEVTQILASLRDGAYAMPPETLEQALEQAWGAQWSDHFDDFERMPFAAASIGQVHRAVDRAGRRLAVKVQYPGIAESIDSDVDNVGRMLKLLRLVPPGLDLDELLTIARSQLHDEADYRLEAESLRSFHQLLDGDDVFRVPEVVTALSTESVLVMTYLDGEHIDALVRVEPPLRQQLVGRLIDLTLMECLHWGAVQSDPNFANFLYDAASGTIGLLDFGALRRFEPGRCRAFAALAAALLDDDLAAVDAAAREVGYLDAEDSFNNRMAIVELLQMAAEPALATECFDFGGSDLMQRMGDRLLELRSRPELLTLPPADVLFLHRKLAGIYLLCARAGVRIDVRARVEAALNRAYSSPQAAPTGLVNPVSPPIVPASPVVDKVAATSN